MSDNQAQLTIYFPNKEERDEVGRKLDVAAEALGFKSRRTLLMALLELPEADLIATMRPIAARHLQRQQETLQKRIQSIKKA